MSQVKATQRPQTESVGFLIIRPKITCFWRTPNSESNRSCTASLDSIHIQNSIICNSIKTETLGILCLSSLSHILVRAFMHFVTNEVEKGREKNGIFWSLKSVQSVLPEQIAVCCFPVGVLWISHLSLLLPFSHYCYMARSLSAWQRDSNAGIFLTM